jgi:hypothetical protein
LNDLDFEWDVSSTQWEDKLQELATYKKQNHGSTNVSTLDATNKPLGTWVANQRTQYRLFQKRKTSHMTPERIKSLNELDFKWSPGGIRSNASWDDLLQELATYKQVNGHTNVPSQCPSNKPLGNWVKYQRTQYKLFQNNKKSVMTQKRIESLNELDFNWGRKKAKASWYDRLQELEKYKQQNNGSTNVPQQFSSNKQLAIWVNTQRYQYKLFQKRKTSHMTPERIKSLNELDFEWVVSSTLWTLWEDKLQELATYKKQNHGSTNVSTLDATNKPLGTWVSKQRTQYKLYQKRKTSHMTPERIKSLNELDFEWKYTI